MLSTSQHKSNDRGHPLKQLTSSHGGHEAHQIRLPFVAQHDSGQLHRTDPQ